jgi:hypothetical protein
LGFILAISSSGTAKWTIQFQFSSTNLTSFFSPNYVLSFGKTRNDVLGVFTNEDPTNLNNIVLFYLTNIDITSTTAPSTAN